MGIISKLFAIGFQFSTSWGCATNLWGYWRLL